MDGGGESDSGVPGVEHRVDLPHEDVAEDDGGSDGLRDVELHHGH